MASNESKGVLKDFVKYVSMNIFSMLGLSLYILADTLFIANGLGSQGLTALNLVLPVYSFINGVGLMLGMGAATRYSILKGQHDHKRADQVFTSALLVGFIIGIVLTAVGVIFSENLSVVLGADSSTLAYANGYLKTITSFSCAFIINNIFVCMVRNDLDPNLAMTAMLAGSFSNIVLDYIFIFPLGGGMVGAAVATGFAPIISMCILSLHKIKGKNQFHFCNLGKKENRSMKLLLSIFSLGVPSFVTEFSSGIIIILFNFTILKIAGNTGVAAYGIIANLALIVAAVFTGIAQGIQPLISKCFGSRQMQNAKLLFKSACILAVVLGISFYLTGLLVPDLIAGIFNRDNDPVLNSMAVEGMKFYFLAFIVMGINIVATTFFSSMSKAVPSFILSLLRGCLLIIVFIILLPPAFEMTGVWFAIPATELTAFVIGIIMLKVYNREWRN